MQWFTLSGIILYLLWEFYFLAEWKSETTGPLIRVDLLFIYPLLITGVCVSLFQFWQKQKAWGALIIGLIIGGIIVTTILWHQIENRYVMGQNNGYLSGSFDMAHFMQGHLNGKSVEPYGVKHFTIEPIEVNGVRTFQITGLEE